MVVSKGVCVADPPLSPSPPSSLTWCIIRCSYVLTMKIPSATPARLPDFVEPMKAKLVGSMPAGNWIYEIKFDGYRALALRGLKARTAFESGWDWMEKPRLQKLAFAMALHKKVVRRSARKQRVTTALAPRTAILSISKQLFSQVSGPCDSTRSFCLLQRERAQSG